MIIFINELQEKEENGIEQLIHILSKNSVFLSFWMPICLILSPVASTAPCLAWTSGAAAAPVVAVVRVPDVCITVAHLVQLTPHVAVELVAFRLRLEFRLHYGPDIVEDKRGDDRVGKVVENESR